ncbi:MAG: DUF3592 domain-containing protein [Flavobacteriales bacterium]|jgi:hypothetical protein|nr:DUF3592 domain-containing protein [Flavobacteriales bacterium]
MKIILIFIVGLIGTIYFYNKVSDQKKTNDWFIVEAQILEIETAESTGITHDVRVEYTHYNILYEYTFNAVRYQSYQISLDGMGRQRTSEVNSLFKEKNWKEGNKTFAFINPMDFTDSVLLQSSTGVSKDNWIGLVLFGVFMVLGGINILLMAF